MIICVLQGDSKAIELQNAISNIGNLKKYFKVYDPIKCNTDEKLLNNLRKDLITASGVIMHFHGSSVNLHARDEVMELIKDKPMFYNCSIPDEQTEMIKESNISPEEYMILFKYFHGGGTENMSQFLRLTINIFEGLNLEISPLIEYRNNGLYDGRIVVELEDEESYLSGFKGKRSAGIVINTSFLRVNNMKHINAVRESLIRRGMEVITVFGTFEPSNEENLYNSMKKYFYLHEEILIDVMVVIAGFSFNSFYQNEHKDYELSLFERFDVPVLQAMTTYLSNEEFKTDSAGLDFASLSVNVYQPEMDGQIITIPIATAELNPNYETSNKLFEPIEDRVEMLTELADRYSRLKHTKNSDKKIALILHNYPPRDDKIGTAFGLDTPASLKIILNLLKESGYDLENEFESGQEIIEELIRRGSNDWRFTSEDVILKEAAYKMMAKEYENIYGSYEDINKNELTTAWGSPPGKTMIINEEMIIPGIIDGNIFIGIQPIRSPGADISEGYHNLKVPPPHSYLGYYKWIDKIFNADAIVHIGTHGSLEWLPGKEVGLDKSSYPDMNIGAMPHLYIYNLGILGEGIQTRRRSHSAVISHMIPSFDDSGIYEGLEEIEELLKNLEHARNSSPGQVELISAKIFEIAKREGIMEDVVVESDENKTIENIHNYIHLIKNSVTRDGLHIFGEIPNEKRYAQLIKGLMMVGQRSVLGLKDSVIKSMGADFEKIRDFIRDIHIDNKENYDILEKATEISNKIVEEFSNNKYEITSIEKILSRYEFVETSDLSETLRFMSEEISPRLNKITNELNALSSGLDGDFILPTMGGNPTRGNIDLLPTGRNFYSIRPEAVPSREAYRVGKELGDVQLNSYLKERDKFPESIMIIVYSTNTMKTYGEDIGEILYLMGLEPTYIGNTEIVSGVKVIPMDELKRPRIDVTLRASGLFRDTFPNIIDLMDKAVEALLKLDETPYENPIKAHVMTDIKDLIKNGMNAADAREYSKVRVYSAPAGTYGAGVSQLIESKEWDTLDDLANAYINWSSHGYSKALHGERMETQMKSILKRTTMTIKNEVSREIDLLDSDDFYNYYGGLIAAVRAESKERPYIAVGNTADPRFVENRDLDLETARVMRSKILNPKWLDGLKEHGYKGAQEISKAVDHLFGWDATSDSGRDWMYEKMAERFLFDEDTLNWMSEVNKTAVYQVSERLLEAHQREMWDADEDVINRIKEIYMSAEGALEDY